MLSTRNRVRNLSKGLLVTSHFLKAILLGSILLATACASTASGAKQSVFVSKSKVTEQTLKTEAPEGSVLAVVRYPAVVDEKAKDKFREAYLNTPMGGRIKDFMKDKTQAHSVIDSTVVKSNYFALSLYKELVARLPEHSVLLSPHEIKLGPDGKLTSEPITMAETLPSVVTVDFAAYSFPDPAKMMGKTPLTFGDLISPIVTVRSDHRSAVPTHGVLLASQPLTEAAAGNGYDTVKADMAELQSGRLVSTIPELDLVSLLSNDPTKSVSTQSLSMKAHMNGVQVAPLEKIRMSGKQIMALDKTKNQGEIDPLKPVFSEAFANRVVDLINDNSSEKSAMAKRAAAIATYDPSLAALTFVGSDSPEYQARYNYVSRMLDAEKKYLSVQSLRLFDGVHNGEMGGQVRDMLKAEYGILQKRRDLARKQNQAAALAIIGAAATAATMGGSNPLMMGGGSNSGSAANDPCANVRRRTFPSPTQQRAAIRACYSDYENRLERTCQNAVRDGRYRSVRECVNQNHYRNQRGSGGGLGTPNLGGGNIFLTGAIYAATQIFAYKDRSKAVGINYLSSIVPALEQQTAVQVSLIDSNETITAIRFDDLKDKLKTLYLEKQRSLDVVASNCAFTGDGSTTGTWMGVCDGGSGNGPGVGVIKKADGTAMEYFGNAASGVPNGPGYMIVHEPSGSYSLEGNFSAGKAEGVMRVSKAGKPDQLRTYSNGEDVGGASSNSVVTSPFNG